MMANGMSESIPLQEGEFAKSVRQASTLIASTLSLNGPAGRGEGGRVALGENKASQAGRYSADR
jgi:hypothetical protein